MNPDHWLKHHQNFPGNSEVKETVSVILSDPSGKDDNGNLETFFWSIMWKIIIIIIYISDKLDIELQIYMFNLNKNDLHNFCLSLV